MGELKVRARELAQDARRTVPLIFAQGDMESLDAAIESAILRFAGEVLLDEPSKLMDMAARQVISANGGYTRSCIRTLAPRSGGKIMKLKAKAKITLLQNQQI